MLNAFIDAFRLHPVGLQLRLRLHIPMRGAYRLQLCLFDQLVSRTKFSVTNVQLESTRKSEENLSKIEK